MQRMPTLRVEQQLYAGGRRRARRSSSHRLARFTKQLSRCHAHDEWRLAAAQRRQPVIHRHPTVVVDRDNDRIKFQLLNRPTHERYDSPLRPLADVSLDRLLRFLEAAGHRRYLASRL